MLKLYIYIYLRILNRTYPYVSDPHPFYNIWLKSLLNMLLTSCHLTNSTDKNNSSVGPLLHTCSLSCSRLLRRVVINDNWSMTTVHLRKAEYCSNIEEVRRQQNNGQVYAHPKLRKVNSKQDPATHDKTTLPFLPALPSLGWLSSNSEISNSWLLIYAT